ncbi:MAG: hypothetical protein EP322_01295 [Bacteroidetes bacterium]|nr:MAG: hypothetical protein EP322_01295 [Bacteroidota bacterium]
MKDPVLPWFIAGPLIGFTVFLLLWLTGRSLGISSSYRVIVSYLAPKKINYFNYERKGDLWQVWFALGLLLAALFQFQVLGFEVEGAAFVYDINYIPQFFLGSFLIGFGSRYAGGCTAGHCIMGNAQFSLASMLSTIGFFAGGLIATYFINTYLF